MFSLLCFILSYIFFIALLTTYFRNNLPFHVPPITSSKLSFSHTRHCIGPMYRITLTPDRTLSISGLKSRVLKLPCFNLKMMMKNGLNFFLKSTEPLQRYLLLTCLTNSAFLGRFFALGSSNSEGARGIPK